MFGRAGDRRGGETAHYALLSHPAVITPMRRSPVYGEGCNDRRDNRQPGLGRRYRYGDCRPEYQMTSV